jgi:hypothetical protein
MQVSYPSQQFVRVRSGNKCNWEIQLVLILQYSSWFQFDLDYSFLSPSLIFGNLDSLTSIQ